MSYELNRENLGDRPITRASHELLHRLTRHKCNIVGQAHEILAHIISPAIKAQASLCKCAFSP